MKTILPLLLALAPLLGCRTNDSDEPEPQQEPQQEFVCICGTPEAAIELCLHPVCLAGENNPDNPDCACGTLSLDD